MGLHIDTKYQYAFPPPGMEVPLPLDWQQTPWADRPWTPTPWTPMPGQFDYFPHPMTEGFRETYHHHPYEQLPMMPSPDHPPAFLPPQFLEQAAENRIMKEVRVAQSSSPPEAKYVPTKNSAKRRKSSSSSPKASKGRKNFVTKPRSAPIPAAVLKAKGWTGTQARRESSMPHSAAARGPWEDDARACQDLFDSTDSSEESKDPESPPVVFGYCFWES